MKHPSEQLAITCKILKKAIDSIATARSLAALPDGHLLIDNNLLKELIQQPTGELDTDKYDELQREDPYKKRSYPNSYHGFTSGNFSGLLQSGI